MTDKRYSNDTYGRILAACLVIYAFIVTYIDGHLYCIPNIHSYVLIPVSAFAGFCFFYYLRNGLRISPCIIPLITYGLYVSIRYIIAGTEDMLAIWGCLLILIMISESVRLHQSFPYWIVLVFGYFQFASMIFQIVFPSFYNNHFAILFTSYEAIAAWSQSYGYSGFCFQVGFASLCLVFSVGFCLAKLFDSSIQGKKRFFYYLQLALFIIAIVLTGKRGTFAIAIIIPVIMLIFNRSTRKIGVIVVLAGLVLGSLSIFILFKYREAFQGHHLLERLSYSVAVLFDKGDFSSGRLFLWERAIDVFKEHPLFGTGMHTYWYYSGTGMDPHNTYLETLCEQGIIGFVLLASSFVVCLIKTIRLKNKGNNATAFALSFSMFIQLEQILDSFLENSMTTNIIELIMYLCAIAIVNSVAVSEESESQSICFGFPTVTADYKSLIRLNNK